VKFLIWKFSHFCNSEKNQISKIGKKKFELKKIFLDFGFFFPGREFEIFQKMIFLQVFQKKFSCLFSRLNRVGGLGVLDTKAAFDVFAHHVMNGHFDAVDVALEITHQLHHGLVGVEILEHARVIGRLMLE